VGDYDDCDANCDGDCDDAGEDVLCANATDDDACDSAEDGSRAVNDGCPEIDADADGDGVLNPPYGTDNCPAVANPNQTDTNTDGQGDACDTDDDGDTILDTDESSNPNGTYDTDWCDSLDASRPATADADSDGVDNTTEATDGTNPCNPDTDSDSLGLVTGGGDPYLRDSVEKAMNTDPVDNCPDSATDDAWGPDFNNTGKVTSGDLVKFRQHYNDVATMDARYDLNGSGGTKITSGDLVVFKKYYPSQQCVDIINNGDY